MGLSRLILSVQCLNGDGMSACKFEESFGTAVVTLRYLAGIEIAASDDRTDQDDQDIITVKDNTSLSSLDSFQLNIPVFQMANVLGECVEKIKDPFSLLELPPPRPEMC